MKVEVFTFVIQIIFIKQDISMALSKKEQQEKDLKAVMAKDIGSKNPIFSPEHIAELHSMFSLYADPRQRRADIRDVLMTAKTLGLDVKNELVYRALEDISYGSGGDALDFESFLRELTAKIGNPFSQDGRRNTFALMDVQGKGELDINDMKFISEQLGYGYSDEQLWDLIHSVGGYGAQTITADRFNRFIEKKTKRKMI